MEEKSIIENNSFLNSSLSGWKLRHQFYQTNRNFRQLENRIAILELEKQKKLKDIENKLNHHRKFVQTKIYKHQLKQAIQSRNNAQTNLSSSNSRIFQSVRQNRNLNIKRQHSDLFMTKHRLFEQTKNERLQNEKKIMVNKLQHLEEKVKKRNRVRLIEIECKENIENFWNQKLTDFQDQRKFEMSRKIKLQEEQMKRLQDVEKNEETLLEEIKKAEQVQSQLNNLIDAQKSMDGSKLENLYCSNVILSQNSQVKLNDINNSTNC